MAVWIYIIVLLFKNKVQLQSCRAIQLSPYLRYQRWRILCAILISTYKNKWCQNLEDKNINIFWHVKCFFFAPVFWGKIGTSHILLLTTELCHHSFCFMQYNLYNLQVMLNKLRHLKPQWWKSVEQLYDTVTTYICCPVWGPGYHSWCIYLPQDGQSRDSWWGRGFLCLSRPAQGPAQPPVQWVPGLFPRSKVAGGMVLTTHPHLSPRLKKE